MAPSSSLRRLAGSLLAGCLTLGCGQETPADTAGDAWAQRTGPPERVIVIGPSSAETLAWLGLAESVVGVSDYCADPALEGRPRVGGQLDPNLERMAALDPDLLIVQGAHPQVEAWCQREQIPLLAWKTQSLAAWREEVRRYGELFDCSARVEQQLADWDRSFAAASAPATEAATPQVLIVASRDPERITRVLAAGRGSFLGELLEHAGARSLFADHERDYFDLAEEALLQLRPDLILELGGSGTDAERLALWRAAFAELPAVKNEAVYGLTEDFVFLPGPRMLETLQLLREKLALQR